MKHLNKEKKNTLSNSIQDNLIFPLAKYELLAKHGPSFATYHFYIQKTKVFNGLSTFSPPPAFKKEIDKCLTVIKDYASLVAA